MTSPALQEIVALLGSPAAGNPAQYLYERMLEAAGLDWRFLTLEVAPARTGDAITGIDALGFRGAVLSGPLRSAALPFVASPSPAASFAGAVSLVDRQASGLVGHMTDGRGAIEALRSHADPAGSRVLIVGAGAVARAALELSLANVAEILVCDRTPERATAFVESLRSLEAAPAEVLPWQATIEIPERVGIVVAAVPADGPKPAFALAGLRNDLVIADFALVPQPSPVVAAAVRHGACAIDGLEIHCAKTAIDFHTWTGIEPDTEMLREALEEWLS
ncbi:MAG: shikimate dehydrogenase family protein [Planctomycetia bacterium]